MIYNKKISCIIRTLNEAEFIGRLIESLRSQRHSGADIEIIIVDSGSTDSTVEIIKKHGVKLIEMSKEQFDYSYSLNLGIKRTKSDLIVILSAHAIPSQNDWLEKMISHFENSKVAGVYSRQIPWPDADLHETLRIERMFGENPRSFSKKFPNADMHFSNAASCIRRCVWEKHPFVIMPAAEDQEWAHWAIENGYVIIYESKAAVCHSHNDSCRKSAHRMIQLEKSADTKLSRKRNLVLTIKQSIGWFIRGIKQILSPTYGKGRRVRLASQCIARSFWYIVDFKRKTE